jgi:hypothetical protein
MIEIADAKTRLEIIQKFYGQISWADECRIHNVKFANSLPLMIHDKSWFWPCLFTSVEQVKHEAGLLLCLTEEAWCLDPTSADPKPCLIVDGDIDDKSMDELIWTLQLAQITPYFTSPESSIAHSQWIVKALDGLDWGRSFADFFAKGRDAKPVFQWD